MLLSDGVVLAGGQSRRMGQAKESLCMSNHVTLLAHAITILQQVVLGTIWISRPHGFPNASAVDVTDSVPSRGPLAGIFSVFEASSAEWLAVLAVDLPSVQPALYLQLEQERQSVPEADVIYGFVPGGYHQPLASLWNRRTLPTLRDALNSDHVLPIQQVLQRLHVLQVPLKNPNWIININTPEEWQQFSHQARL